MSNLKQITVGGGCFWCIEAIFQRIKGVEKVVSGYAGGDVVDPTYRAVCSGDTGHAEVVQITFDTSIISLDELLDVFFHLHDPTTLNRQGADVGSQYRSVIFYTDEEQKQAAQKVIDKITEEKIYSDSIVTEISPLDVFYPAENYHQNYFNQNSEQGYCRVVIDPKINKLMKEYKEKLS